MHDQDDWTLGGGIMSGVIAQVWRVPLCMATWAGLLYVAFPAIDYVADNIVLSARSLPGVVLVVVAASAIPSFAIGALIAHRLTDLVGCSGVIPAMVGVAAVWLAVEGGTQMAGLLRGEWSWLLRFTSLAVGLLATLTVVWRSWVNPP